MIANPGVFEETFVPADTPHRHDELRQLSRALRPLERGEPGEKVSFLFGPSGTGKTCLSRYILNEVKQANPAVDATYVNCWEAFSRFKILEKSLNEFNSTANIHRRSTPTDELVEKVKSYDGDGYVIVLDEVDQIDDHNVLYDLYGVPNLSLILIANDEEEFFAMLDDRLVSRLHTGRRVDLDKYGVEELADILEKRVDYGLRGYPINRNGLRLIADLAAGDARRGIGILRFAAKLATDEGQEQITEETIRDATPNAKEAHRESVVEKLRDHQVELYEIIQEHSELAPGELYELYQKRVDEPKTNRTVRNYLQKMVHYELIEAEGEKRARVYRIKPES